MLCPVDGRCVAVGRTLGNEVLEIALMETPDEGMHLLQANARGLMSNDHLPRDGRAEQTDQPTLGELVQRSGWDDLIEIGLSRHTR